MISTLAARVKAPPNTPPIVVLPGFGNSTRDYDSLSISLRCRGFKNVNVLDIERKDWFNVGRMMFSSSYWKGACTTREGYAWYLERVKACIETARQSSGGDKVVLVGHRAGPRIYRAAAMER